MKKYITVCAVALAAIAGALVSGCGPAKPTLNVYMWSDYIDLDLVREFEKQNNCKVVIDIFDSNEFMYSKLKAGGTGLNLTGADIVIHFDPWWNVAVQNQATDRAHRIGQKNVVTVYRLIAQDTIEEKIVQLQEKKSRLAEQILGGEEMGPAALSKEALMEILGTR